jgi:Stigma-specific protein, Stig1
MKSSPRRVHPHRGGDLTGDSLGGLLARCGDSDRKTLAGCHGPRGTRMSSLQVGRSVLWSAALIAAAIGLMASCSTPNTGASNGSTCQAATACASNCCSSGLCALPSSCASADASLGADDASSDSAAEAGSDSGLGSDGDSCPVGQAPCGGACVDTQTDPSNCGACGAACGGTCALGCCLVTLSLAASEVSGIAVDSTSVYWTNYYVTNAVMKVALGGGTSTTLASGESGSTGIALDATSVYWTNVDGTVKKVPLDGGAPITLASGQTTPWPSP